MSDRGDAASGPPGTTADGWPRTDPLAHRVSSTPETTALVDVDADASWTYREFHRRVDRVAAAFPAGDRVGVLMDTRPAFATAVFAAMRTDTTLVPLNVRETPRELATKVARADLEALLCESATEATALDVAGDGPGAADGEPDGLAVYSVDDPTRDGVAPLPRDGSGDSPRPPGPETVEPATLEPTTEQLVLFTSGTTGTPKGVRLTVGNLFASATASAFRLGVLPDDRWLCCLPMYHTGGLAPVLRSAQYGTTVAVQREFEPDETARVLEAYEITGVSLVPTMLARLLDAGWEPADSLRFVLLGGAPASDALLERCEAAGVPVYPTYGMTETASQVATATPDEAFAHAGTVGRPLAFTEVAVVDDGESVPPGEPGELVVSGPTVTPGYLEEARTAAAFDERGLHTGDVGYRDDAGRLWILNRRSDRIVTGGETVDPGEVVDALRSHAAVESAAVVGLSDEEWGERVAALVVADPGDPPAVDDLLEHCRDRLADFKRPKTVAFADELPRTHSGTVDREAVRRRLEAELRDATDE